LIPGVDGEVWVLEYAGVLARRASYVVYGTDGRARGRVTLGDRERLISVGREHLVTLHRDDDYLESVLVRTYRRDVP
jgi:hypothetical protein